MECNKEEAERCKALSEAHFKRQDLVGAKKYAVKAKHLFPELEGLPQLFSILDVHIAAHQKLGSGESNCYAILQVDFRADENTIRKQYRKLALVLHPDKNKAFGAEAAFKHISEAWSVLSDRNKKLGFDKRWLQHMAAPATHPSHGTFQKPTTLHKSRVSVPRVNISISRNMNWPPQSQAHVHPQQGAHAHRQQGHVQAHVSQQGHGQVHAHYQQGQVDPRAYQRQWQVPVPRRYQGQGQGQARVPRHQGQGQGKEQAPQQQERDQACAPEQQWQSQGHVHQQRQGQAHAHQGLGQGQAHVHQQQGQGHEQEGQDQVHAQHQQGQRPAHAHRPQGQDSMQAQGRVHQAPAPQMHHAHEQQLQGQGHVHQQQGPGPAPAPQMHHAHEQQLQGQGHAHQQQGKDPTQAQGEAHQAQAPQNHHTEHNQAHGSKPSQPAFKDSKSTFWTACPSCRMQLEYERAHMNKNLCCPMCYKAFVSKEIAPVLGSVLWPPPILQSKPPVMQSKPDSKTDAGIKSGLFDTNSDWIPSADSTLPSRVHSNKKTQIGTEGNLHRQDGQNLQGSPAKPSQKPPVELQQKGLGRLKKDELRKRVAIQAKEGIERLIARSKGVIAQKLSEEKEMKAAADKVSAAGQNQKADIERSALASEPVQSKPVAAEKEGYVHNTEEKANDADACNSRMRTRNSARPCKEARFSQEGSRFVKSKHAGTGISKVETLHRKRKLASPMDKSLEDQNEGVSKFIKDFESYPGSKDIKVSNDSLDDAVKTADECKMEVPDPDFHNFDGDRTEGHFSTGQIWASYDDDDGMPRYYTRVNKVLSLQPLKMQMDWLEAHDPSDETRAWLDSGFQHSCGDFKLGSTYVAEEVSTFSHLMSVDKGLKGGYKIYPKQGEVWAVYKDWEILKVKEDKRGYDMVEIVAAFDEERGLQVTPLFKVTGFKTIFESKSGEGHVKWIIPQEMRRFSHQVPAHRIVAGEVPRILVDCLELDPASTPMNLIYGM